MVLRVDGGLQRRHHPTVVGHQRGGLAVLVQDLVHRARGARRQRFGRSGFGLLEVGAEVERLRIVAQTVLVEDVADRVPKHLMVGAGVERLVRVLHPARGLVVRDAQPVQPERGEDRLLRVVLEVLGVLVQDVLDSRVLGEEVLVHCVQDV